MNSKTLKNLTGSTAEAMHRLGGLTHFEFMFRKFLLGEIDWPRYEAEDIIRFRKRFDLTQDALGQLLGISAKTINGWESGTKHIPPLAHIVFCTCEKLGPDVFEMMSSRASDTFMLQKIPLDDAGINSAISVPTREQKLFPFSEDLPPEPFDKTAVYELRQVMRLTRKEFAEKMSVSSSTIDKWEQGNILPKGPALRLLQQTWLRAHAKSHDE